MSPIDAVTTGANIATWVVTLALIGSALWDATAWLRRRTATRSPRRMETR